MIDRIPNRNISNTGFIAKSVPDVANADDDLKGVIS